MSQPVRRQLFVSPSPAKGFAVISALFLIVVLAALGAFMVTFSNTQQLTSAQDIQGTRAYWAARAGLEWGIYQASSQQTGWVTTCPSSTNLGIVEGFTVTVNCTFAQYTEGGASPKLYRVSARATAGTLGSVGYVERSVTASLER